MNLQNGYKVIYEKIEDGKRTFLASKTGLFADAEVITEATIGEYKLIYEKDGSFYGSTTGLPSDEDYRFEGFDKVFKAAAEAAEATTVEEVEEVEEEASEKHDEAVEPEEAEELDEELEEDEN